VNKNYEESSVMKELHTIREEFSEQTKNMSFNEKMKIVEEEAKKIMEEYHMNFKVAEKH
jgi:hypothetical protein